MITVYSKNNCVQCKMTKNWLSDKAITFNEINVDNDLAGLNYLIENNLRTLPVVFKDDTLVAMGFQPNKLEVLKGGK